VAVLRVLEEGAGRLVRRVQPDNLPAFARLFTAALLQAAATGEALLDDELGDLARRDPSRFSRLTQRFQVQPLTWCLGCATLLLTFYAPAGHFGVKVC
jgi:hypothetical protein